MPEPDRLLAAKVRSGVPLARHERHRLSTISGDQSTAVEAYAKEQPAYAGTWIAHGSTPRVIHIGFTADEEETLARIRERFTGIAPEIRSLGFQPTITRAGLGDLVRRIDADGAWLRQEGIHLEVASEAIERNTVAIGIRGELPGVEARLQRRYGPHVSVYRVRGRSIAF